jgi:hypothetical protein
MNFVQNNELNKEMLSQFVTTNHGIDQWMPYQYGVEIKTKELFGATTYVFIYLVDEHGEIHFVFTQLLEWFENVTPVKSYELRREITRIASRILNAYIQNHRDELVDKMWWL